MLFLPYPGNRGPNYETANRRLSGEREGLGLSGEEWTFKRRHYTIAINNKCTRDKSGAEAILLCGTDSNISKLFQSNHKFRERSSTDIRHGGSAQSPTQILGTVSALVDRPVSLCGGRPRAAQGVCLCVVIVRLTGQWHLPGVLF